MTDQAAIGIVVASASAGLVGVALLLRNSPADAMPAARPTDARLLTNPEDPVATGTLVLLLAGLVLLVLGGELLVRGGSGLGRRLGLSPVVVGLTIVAFATSAPELAVCISAALSGAPALAVGNVVGSNVANSLLVLGAAAVVLPVLVEQRLVRTDVPIMMALSVLLWVLALDGQVGRVEGLVLVLSLGLYVLRSVRATPGVAAAPAASPVRSRAGADLVRLVGGVAALVLGARLLVDGATAIARAAGLSDLVIGLTVVAVGTSLPEIATSVVGALRGERALAVGNIVGSNIFNVGAVMGMTAVLAPSGVPIDPAAIRFDLPVMIAAGLLLAALAFTGLTVRRWEAVLLLAYYGAYVGYLLLDANDHDAQPAFSAALLVFALPLTAAAVVALVVYELRPRAASRSDA